MLRVRGWSVVKLKFHIGQYWSDLAQENREFVGQNDWNFYGFYEYENAKPD